MSTAAFENHAVRPAVLPLSRPNDIEALHLPPAMPVELALKRIATEGESSMTSLGRSLKLSTPIVDEIFRLLRKNQLIEVKRALGEDYAFSLSAAGRDQAAERLKICQYAGAAPVSLEDYRAVVLHQAPRLKLNRAALRAAFDGLVLEDRLLDKLGPALISQKSLFLYGPTGNGKTSLAERLCRVYDDMVLVPYAVEVDGQIIVVYDPVVHRKVEGDFEDLDQRWVVCRRPSVIVGGELTAPMLDLQLDEASNIYAAPVQMKANNGVLVIDDFGRQVIPPHQLLNRWIIPLDRRVDYLALRYGVKFEVPFELMVTFSTNLDPKSLADEAFLRRIHNKIYLGAVTAEGFDEIFVRTASRGEIQFEPASASCLRDLCYRAGCSELRACYPGDICDILGWIARYEDRPPVADAEGLQRAVDLYFSQTLQ